MFPLSHCELTGGSANFAALRDNADPPCLANHFGGRSNRSPRAQFVRCYTGACAFLIKIMFLRKTRKLFKVRLSFFFKGISSFLCFISCIVKKCCVSAHLLQAS